MKTVLFFTFVIAGLILFDACYYDNKEELYVYLGPSCGTTAATYSKDIAPILQTHCTICHSNADAQGGVNLEGYNKVKQYADQGALYGSANHDAGYAPMPSAGVKIPRCELEKLKLWVDGGALDD